MKKKYSKKMIAVSSIGAPYIFDIGEFRESNKPQQICICRADKSCTQCKAYITTRGDNWYNEDVYDTCAFGHMKEFNPNNTNNDDYKKKYSELKRELYNDRCVIGREIASNLKYGTKIKIGKDFAKNHSYLKEGEIIELIEGWFENDNGLYCYDSKLPSIINREDEEWNENNPDEVQYESIYHLFGNNIENFRDCKILDNNCKKT